MRPTNTEGDGVRMFRWAASLKDRAEQAETRITRLRAALQEIADQDSPTVMREIARAALAEGPEGRGD